MMNATRGPEGPLNWDDLGRPWRTTLWALVVVFCLIVVGFFNVASVTAWVLLAVCSVLIGFGSWLAQSRRSLRWLSYFIPLGDWLPALWWTRGAVEDDDLGLASRILRTQWNMQHMIGFHGYPAFTITSMRSNALGLVVTMAVLVPVTVEDIAKAASMIANSWKVDEVRYDSCSAREIILTAVTRDPLKGTRHTGGTESVW